MGFVEPELSTLAEILATSDRFNWSDKLYCEPVFPYTKTTKAAVLPEDYTERELEEAGEPEFAVKNGLTYTLGMQALQDLASSARKQKPDCTTKDLIAAFNYYLDHDAFIEFSCRS